MRNYAYVLSFTLVYLKLIASLWFAAVLSSVTTVTTRATVASFASVGYNYILTNDVFNFNKNNYINQLYVYHL
jgi:hypothetical protein